ncbi:MAG: exonuclease SbcCD subunit D C-terminal domain-containing protein, partial [Ginsengibacter sp.]
MKILHTADWHLGQLFYQYDRSYEHGLFLDWLLDTIGEHDVDALLVSGDVFDVSNPSAASIRIFYSFLNKAIRIYPHLQIIVTAGNHDSASRLEAPKPLLESSNIQIIGLIQKTEDGTIDFERLLIPLSNREGEIKIWCMAIPFLRMGDYPTIPDSTNPYSDGVSKLYTETYEFAQSKRTLNQPIIAMGHLHAMKVSFYDKDSHDREIMGGVECIPLTAFHEEISYTALGHIHRAQTVGEKDTIRYSGSPIPLSFSEINYVHQVLLLEYNAEGLHSIQPLKIPVSIPLVKIPKTPAKLSEVIEELMLLEEAVDKDIHKAPYLEVNVLLDGPEPSMRYQIENALTGKYIRLARIVTSYKTQEKNTDLK